MSRPQQFGHYELLARVAVGGMAEIFRAVDKQSGEICAVKRILPEIADDEEFISMFRDECKIVGQLEHPNICRILELGRVDSDWFLAMQYVEGLDLRALFDRANREHKRLELPFLLHVFMRTCEGLEYAHRKRDPAGRPLNVVHRDVSPQNILVGFDGHVKLIDFGIAKSNGKLSKTQVGTIKGKYGYMSPEQVRGLPLDHRSDLFSLGICMYELLTKKRLFAADNELLIMERIKEADVPPPRTVDSSIPTTVEDIVMRALARDVTDRYASAADLYADLQAFAFSEGLVWGKDAVADYMQRTFGDGAAKPSPNELASKSPNSSLRNGARKAHVSSAGAIPTEPLTSRRVQENSMSDNKGSDLDVFEGLTSKRGTNRPPSSAGAPPPPPNSRSVPPPPPPTQRRQMATQMGMGLPPMPSVPGTPRMSTPPIAPPPSRAGGTGGPPPPPSKRSNPPTPPPPSAQARGAMVDMDWDDEDEKTHIYDKDLIKDAFGPMTSKGVGPLPPPSAPAPKATMMGMANPLPPPPRDSGRPVPPPPPSRSSRGVPPPPSPPPSSSMPSHPSHPSGPPLAATMMQSHPAPFAPNAPPMTAPMPQHAPSPAPINVAPAMPAQTRPVADATQMIRPKSGGNAGLIVGALVLAAAAGVGAFFWMSSRPGNVLVNVDVKGPKGTKVSVSLDGNEKCTDSTCRIEGISPGAHTVKAIAGDVEKKATINVEPGKDAIANLTLEVAAKKTGVKLASSQTGVKVEIDGGSPRALPVEDDTLKSGDHTLKFTGPGGRYGSKEVKITLEDGQIKTLDEVKLPLKSVKTKFVFLTKGTKATLDDGSKKQDLKDDGQPIELETTKSYTVVANAPGHEEFSKKIEFGDEPEQAVKLELAEKGKPVAVAPTPGPGPVAAIPKPNPTPTPTPTPTPVASGEGSLFVNTLPASACVVDGTPRGKTPFTIKLAPGSHSITCVAKDGDETLKKSSSANVNAGETAKVILKLRD